MAYVLPTFNLTCNIYQQSTYPSAPRLSSLCNLCIGKRVYLPQASYEAFQIAPTNMFLLLPKLTDIRSQLCAGGEDVVEVPAGSGRIYKVCSVDDVGKGFANEHRIALIFMYLTPTPIP